MVLNMPSPYNTTDLDPEATFERHVFHRDQFAHFMRWSHVLKETRRLSHQSESGTARTAGTVVDFGCGRGHLLEVMYRNKFPPQTYHGIDIRRRTIEAARAKWARPIEAGRDWHFHVDDLVKPELDFSQFQADTVVSFEVAEHVGRQNVPTFLRNFLECGALTARYYLSTPNFDARVGAAGSHTYDSGRLLEDGTPAGVEVQELEHHELMEMIMGAGFQIEDRFGTFASKRDYRPTLGPCQQKVFEALDRYYDSELVATIMAPIVGPALARNCLWVLRRA